MQIAESIDAIRLDIKRYREEAKVLILEAQASEKQLRDAGYEVDEQCETVSPLAPTKPSAAILDELVGRLERGEGDIVFELGELDGFEIGPRKVTILGAPPGAGKTAFASQVMFEALGVNPTLRVVVANAEMGFDVLLRREITRRAGVSSRDVRFATLDADQLAKVRRVVDEIRPLLDRVDVLEPPYTAAMLDRLASETPGLLVADYLQKFSTGDDARLGVNQVVTSLRNLAMQGWAILALSATTRTKGGHVSAELTMASFKESGEVEFNADSAYLLRDNGEAIAGHPGIRSIELDCVKNRHGERESMALRFDMPAMSFKRELAFYEFSPESHNPFDCEDAER
jgi:replicative DNA helicase